MSDQSICPEAPVGLFCYLFPRSQEDISRAISPQSHRISPPSPISISPTLAGGHRLPRHRCAVPRDFPAISDCLPSISRQSPHNLNKISQKSQCNLAAISTHSNFFFRRTSSSAASPCSAASLPRIRSATSRRTRALCRSTVTRPVQRRGAERDRQKTNTWRS